VITQDEIREWSSTEKLPAPFVEWLKFVIRMSGAAEGKPFFHIADDLGVLPSLLSRWVAGMGPLTQANIQTLATNISPVVYIALGMKQPSDSW